MDFFCWACYINCIFKYYKIFVTDRYFSKLGLTVSDSDWNIYVMAPLQGGRMQGVGRGTRQQESQPGLAAPVPCSPELPSQLSLGATASSEPACTEPSADIWTHSPSLLLSLKSRLFHLLALPCPAAAAEEPGGHRAALPRGRSRGSQGSAMVLLAQGSCSQLLPKPCQSLPETEHSFW